MELLVLLCLPRTDWTFPNETCLYRIPINYLGSPANVNQAQALGCCAIALKTGQRVSAGSESDFDTIYYKRGCISKLFSK